MHPTHLFPSVVALAQPFFMFSLKIVITKLNNITATYQCCHSLAQRYYRVTCNTYFYS